MLKRREEFRQRLVSLICAKDEVPPPTTEEDLEGEFPSAEERDVLRYYYYIKHGVDTIHVSPIKVDVLKRINALIPSKYLRYPAIIETNLNEVKNEYTMSVKKAVVDFVLGETLHKNSQLDDVSGLTTERLELRQLAMKYRHKYGFIYIIWKFNSYNLCAYYSVRYLGYIRMMNRNLFSINPCVAQVMKSWFSFGDVNFVSLAKLTRPNCYELAEFTVSCSSIKMV